jgi:hypothetical protein
VGTEVLSSGVKRQVREVNYSRVSISEVKNEWSCTSTPNITLHVVKRQVREVNYSRVSISEVKNEWSCTSTPNITLHVVDRKNFTCLISYYPRNIPS